MGLFPIVMNILQFWLIDSIVKASAGQVALQLVDESPRLSADTAPLFQDPDSDDDGDEGLPNRRHDIENPRSPVRSRSRSQNSRKSSRIDEEEQKSVSSKAAPTPILLDELEHHEYPPSLSSSFNDTMSSHSLRSHPPSFSPRPSPRSREIWLPSTSELRDSHRHVEIASSPRSDELRDDDNVEATSKESFSPDCLRDPQGISLTVS